MVNIEDAVVVVICIFGVRDTVVVIVDVIEGGFAKTLRHDSLIPNCLEETIVVNVGVVSVIVIVIAVSTAKEIAVFLASIVVVIVIRVDFEIIPDAVVIVVDIIPIIDRIVIIVKVDRHVGEIAINVAVDVILEQVSAQFIREISNRSVVGGPLPKSCREAHPGDESVPVIGHLNIGNT